jgi:hypothetical protein
MYVRFLRKLLPYLPHGREAARLAPQGRLLRLLARLMPQVQDDQVVRGGLRAGISHSW